MKRKKKPRTPSALDKQIRLAELQLELAKLAAPVKAKVPPPPEDLPPLPSDDQAEKAIVPLIAQRYPKLPTALREVVAREIVTKGRQVLSRMGKVQTN